MDVTSMVAIPESASGIAQIVTRETCIVAGLPVAETVFREVDPSLHLERLLEDGTAIPPGTVILKISGSLRSILTGERTALNFLQRLSGVATQTQAFVQAIAGTKARILDTRKTTPGLRALEKYAVRCGGGENHRVGLYDQFLFKDNHLTHLNTPEKLRDAVARARALDAELKIEIEADTLDQVRQIVPLGIDRILLDNMSLDLMTEAVGIIGGRCETEASGNMSLNRVHAIAQCGVDFISVGSLTHSVRAIDLSLEVLADPLR